MKKPGIKQIGVISTFSWSCSHQFLFLVFYIFYIVISSAQCYINWCYIFSSNKPPLLYNALSLVLIQRKLSFSLCHFHCPLSSYIHTFIASSNQSETTYLIDRIRDGTVPAPCNSWKTCDTNHSEIPRGPGANNPPRGVITHPQFTSREGSVN